MELKSKYITADDFKAYTGIDLYIELKDDDNASNKVDAFLFRIEHRLITFIESKFYRNIAMEYHTFTDYQKEHYKFAILEQALYVFKNGDLSVDSGYDMETGKKISMAELDGIVISPNCKNELLLCGLWCRKIKNRFKGGAINGWLC